MGSSACCEMCLGAHGRRLPRQPHLPGPRLPCWLLYQSLSWTLRTATCLLLSAKLWSMFLWNNATRRGPIQDHRRKAEHKFTSSLLPQAVPNKILL
ncbi:hypothetical protein IscW_ISCW017471, partial [Ixodes scapularis]